ncbi:MAG: penicillin-binding protein 2 [Gammaproteobacteria bacterium]|nr:penicillin-binding protein 2 [Gammaproteobacteria bacterium]
MLTIERQFFYRFWLIALLLFGLQVLLLGRLFSLSWFERDFLIKENTARVQRTIIIPAHRGRVLDRNQQPLALTKPSKSVWISPSSLNMSQSEMQRLAAILHIGVEALQKRIQLNKKRDFLYLKRGISKQEENEIIALNYKQVYFQQGYSRYYPDGEAVAHILGFVNVDGDGQEGIELAYNSLLKGMDGKAVVTKDRLGRIIAKDQLIQQARPGSDLLLTIDKRLQYLSYAALKEGVESAHAKSGSAVVVDVATGQILAMVNYPAYDPNDRIKKVDYNYKNRVITDVFEPGSTLKPFSIAALLSGHKVSMETTVDTSPGHFNLNGKEISDEHNNGVVTLRRILQRSSQVGIAKLSRLLKYSELKSIYAGIGLTDKTYIGLPGETSGVINFPRHYNQFDMAALSFGYGISVTQLQLTQAYVTLANYGQVKPMSIITGNDNALQENQVISASISKQIIGMLTSVTEAGGTGVLANVKGVKVAGKTSTTHIFSAKGYHKNKYISSFVGMAPAEMPKIVVSVVVNQPDKKHHFGALSAAPTFAKIMQTGLHLAANS